MVLSHLISPAHVLSRHNLFYLTIKADDSSPLIKTSTTTTTKKQTFNNVSKIVTCAGLLEGFVYSRKVAKQEPLLEITT